MMHHSHHHHAESGFVILFAIVIAAALILLGGSIFRIALKETVLSSTASESQVALFAADTAMECGLYHEFIDSVSPTIRCIGDDQIAKDPVITSPKTCSPESRLTNEYQFKLSYANELGIPSCAFVEVRCDEPPFEDAPSDRGVGTMIRARGFNICAGTSEAPEPDVTNPALVERRLEAWFPNPVPLDLIAPTE